MSKTVLAVAALMIATPLLAGCLQEDGLALSSLSEMTPRYSGTLTFPQVLAYDGNGTPLEIPPELLGDAAPWGIESLVPESGAEPNVGVTSAGNIFVTSGDKTFRSKDKGLTWEEVHDLVSLNFPTSPDQWRSADPMLWVDTDTDRVFVNHMHPSLQCTYMAWSDDEGETWTERPYACAIPGTDHQKVMTAKPGPNAKFGTVGDYPNIIYVCQNKREGVESPTPLPVVGDMANLGTTCFYSLDGGMTYPYETAAYVNDKNCGNINGHPAAFPDGTVAVVLGNLGARCERPMTIVLTEDNGLTWELRQCAPEYGNVEIDADITVTPDGTAYVLFRHTDQLVYLARSTDKFQSCEVFKVTPPDLTMTVFTGITSGDDGRIAMGFLGTRDPQEANTTPSFATLGTYWHAFVVTSFDANAENPTFVAQQVTPEEDPVQVGCIWLGGGAGGPYQCRNLLDFVDMSRDPDGRYVFAITDGCTPRNGCTGSPDQSDFQSRDRQIGVIIQARGTSLFAEKGILPPLDLVPPQPLDR